MLFFILFQGVMDDTKLTIPLPNNLRLTVRPKMFSSVYSLWYEEERLATFIDWPIMHLSKEELAREGFYYLRNKDYCACIFCRGIIGSWEEGETPQGKHKRHFPNCKFVLGVVTENVPYSLGKILKKFPNFQFNAPKYKDVCGIYPRTSHENELKLKNYVTKERRLKTFTKEWPKKLLRNLKI